MPEETPDLSDMELPYKVEGVTLMSPGRWNNREYSMSVIESAMEQTNFDEDHNASLFWEHDDEDARDWMGEIKNPRVEDGELVGDMMVVDEDAARKLEYGAHFGISPKVSGRSRGKEMQDFRFENFSLVIDPAVKTTYLNSEMEVMKMSEDGTEAESVEEPTDEMEDGTDDYGPVVDGEDYPDDPAELDEDVLLEAISEKYDVSVEEAKEILESDGPMGGDDEDDDEDGSEMEEADSQKDDGDTMTEDETAESGVEEYSDDFAQFAEEYRAEHDDASPDEVVEAYEEAQKSPEEKAQEMAEDIAEEKVSDAMSDLKDEIASLKDELSSTKEEVENTVQETKHATRRGKTLDEVQEMSEDMSEKEVDAEVLKELQADYRGRKV